VWDVYAASTIPSFDGKSTMTVTQTSYVAGKAVPAGFRLVGPNGSPPSSAYRLSAPPVPSASGTYETTFGQSQVPATSFSKPKDAATAEVIAPTISITLTGVGSLKVVGTGQNQRVAPKGSHLLVARLHVGPGPNFPEPHNLNSTYGNSNLTPADAQPTIALVRGYQHTALSQLMGMAGGVVPGQGTQSFGSQSAPPTPTTEYLVAVVRNGSSPYLEVTVDGGTQKLYLTTGARQVTVSSAYYRHDVIDATAATYPNHTESVGNFAIELGGYVPSAYLTAFDPVKGWAPAGKAWLEVPVRQVPQQSGSSGSYTTSTSSIFCSYNYISSPASVSIHVGSVIYPQDASAGALGTYAFLVPETFSTGTFVWDETGHFTQSSSSFGNCSPASGTFQSTQPFTIPLHF
jgi:hypothetical protein